jgi:BlaI family transcriptional regulator, penicillinase repressor
VGDDAHFTQRELDIMSVLWRRGSGTVAEVRTDYGPGVGYTGVLKLLQILEGKGMVRHELEGRAYRYYPVVEPDDAGGAALGRIVDKIFLGSAEMAVARLVSDRGLDQEEVDRLKALLDAAVQDSEKGGRR